MEYWKQLLIKATLPNEAFPPLATIGVMSPTADEFFAALHEIDDEFFPNASDYLKINGQECRYIYCFSHFYMKTEDENRVFDRFDQVEDYLRQNAVELDVETRNYN